MKTKIFLSAILVVALLSLISSTSVNAQNQLPPIFIHVAPSNCSGNIQGQNVVRLTHSQGTYWYDTDANGWTINATAPVGNVEVYATYGSDHGEICGGVNQPEGGYATGYVCLNNYSCYLEKRPSDQFGSMLIPYE